MRGVGWQQEVVDGYISGVEGKDSYLDQFKINYISKHLIILEY